MKLSKRGFVDPASILLYTIIIGGVIWLVKPMGSKETRAAKASVEASATVVNTTNAFDEGAKKRDAIAAARLQQMSLSANKLSPSPDSLYLQTELPLTFEGLGTVPDHNEELASMQRRLAYEEGRTKEAQALTDVAYKKNAQQAEELGKLKVDRDAAFEARRQVDEKLTTQAAVNIALERRGNIQLFSFVVIAVLLLGGWIYSKVFSIGPATIGKMVADLRAGAAPIQTFDTYLAPYLHSKVAKAAKLATPLVDTTNQS